MLKLARLSWACCGAAAVLGTAALAALAARSDDSDQFLEAPAILLAIAAGGFLLIGAGLLLAAAFRGIWQYYHAVEILAGDWHFHYWPLQRRAEVSGLHCIFREWAGSVVVNCRAITEGNEAVEFTYTHRQPGEFTVSFPQKDADLKRDPAEGEDATIIVWTTMNDWWRGASVQRTVSARVGITDHRS